MDTEPNTMASLPPLSPEQTKQLLATLSLRFKQHPNRHPNFNWADIEKKLDSQPDKLRALFEMENSGGEPDVIGDEVAASEYHFYDCAPESPQGRRSLCYDKQALDERKENKPAGSVIETAASIGAKLLTELEYRLLQKFGPFDTKTSSWLATPADIREKGGAIFGDYRYGTVFIYHNGAGSYYAARGFRTLLKV